MVIDREWSFFQRVERARSLFLFTHLLWVSSLNSLYSLCFAWNWFVSISLFYQVGLGTFLLGYLSGLLRAVLTEIGINEDMYNPVCKLIYFDNCLCFFAIKAKNKFMVFLFYYNVASYHHPCWEDTIYVAGNLNKRMTISEYQTI